MRRLASRARSKTPFSGAGSDPLALARRSAARTWPWIWTSPTTRESSPLTTRTRCRSACGSDSVNRSDSNVARGTPAASARALAEAAGVPLATFESDLFTESDPQALRHLVRVVSGLDSLVVGDVQIHGQVRAALRLASAK